MTYSSLIDVRDFVEILCSHLGRLDVLASHTGIVACKIDPAIGLDAFIYHLLDRLLLADVANVESDMRLGTLSGDQILCSSESSHGDVDQKKLLASPLCKET